MSINDGEGKPAWMFRDLPPADPKDLEVITCCLELAAIELTPKSDATFTREELYTTAQKYAGDDCVLDPKDLDIVLPFVKFIQKLPGKRYQLK